MTEGERREKLNAKAKTSPLWWFIVFSQILNKDAQLICPNKPNICQVRLADAYEKAVQRGIPFRCIIVKPRQIGISTFAAAIAYWVMRTRSCAGVIMADTLGRSDKLFAMVDRFARSDRFPWPKKPMRLTETEIQIGESILDKSSAERPTAGRAGTTQVLVATEAAFYPRGGKLDAAVTMTALLNSVPLQPGTVVIIESTADGPVGYFPDKWKQARWPDWDDYWKKYQDGHEHGDGEYIRIFVAWWEIDEYCFDGRDGRRRMFRGEAETIMATLSPKERQLIALWERNDFKELITERLAWRRFMIKNQCGNDEIKFAKEYPSSPDEPFQVSGSARFDTDGMTYLVKLSSQANFKTGTLTTPRGFGEPPQPNIPKERPQFIPGPLEQSWLKLFELAKVGCSYIIGEDISSDRDVSPNDMEVDRDKHSLVVIRQGFTNDSGRIFRPAVVARFVTPCEWGHKLLARNTALVSLFFGGCPIAIEMNNHGLSVCNYLRQLDANILKRTLVNPHNGKETIILGWQTTEHTRPAIIENLANSVSRIAPAGEAVTAFSPPPEPDCLEIADKDIVTQMLTFVINSQGRAEGASGAHDDDVLATAIAYYLVGCASKYVELVIPRVMPRGDYAWAAQSSDQSDLPPI